MSQRLYLGLSKTDVLAPIAVAALLASLVLPSLHTQATKLQRADAIAALTNIEIAQENFRARNGAYARTLAQLEVIPTMSNEGYYALELQNASASGYTAVARSLPGEASYRNDFCGTLTLTIVRGHSALRGPSPRCWAR